MEENTLKTPQADVRVLTLKWWNFPQTTRLFPSEGKEVATVGDYISYNSHHFIHIEECPQMDDQPICRVHRSLERLRANQRDIKDTDFHTVQSLALVGEKGDFWDIPGDVLYISFLQLTNSAVFTIDDIRKDIASIITSRSPGASWELYYSLDFCDLVLFTKNLSYEECSKIMWDLAIVRKQGLDILRDTFTIYGFRRGFLMDAFRKLHNGEHLEWTDHASLSINLSIQSYEVWKNFENSLEDAHIPYRPLRTFGRYDIRLVTDDLSGRQILQLLYLVDVMAGESKDRAFGGYEVSMEASTKYESQGKSMDAHQDRELEQVAIDTMDLLCKMCAQAEPDSADYVDETRRSLAALLKNGFSEEFVLSVLPTFLDFLQIVSDVQSYRDRTNPKKEEVYQLKESQEKMTRHYFNALNILALCTMHSERQFVQAPAFNATYFDVPPKLLAFYSAVAREILDALRFGSDADYNFLFVPNYHKDINVRPLELEMKENLSHHLAVAHLHESYFYNPALTIKLFCHEAAHYLSDRHREYRAKYIFRVVSFLVLANTPLRFVLEQTQDNSILAVMADFLADLLMSKFVEQTPHSTRNIPYHLNDVSEFLFCTNYGIEFFQNSIDIHHICVGWQNALHDKMIQNPDVFRKIFSIGLCAIQETLQSNYLIEQLEHDHEEMYVYEVFSRVIALHTSLIDVSKNDNEFCNICENIIQAFSEAYADLRMIELIGEEFSWKDYTDMFMQVDVGNHYQMILRHDAVLNTVAPKDDWEALIPKEDDSLVFSYVAEQISQYLGLCHARPAKSDQVVQILRDFNGGDANKQCGCIRDTIQRYRIYLTRYCRKILEEYSFLKQ